MAYATPDDVQDRLLDRTLTASELATVGVLLEDVETMIASRIPDLDALVAASSRFRDLVVMVEANAVLRVVKNPDGLRFEADGNYSYTKDAKAAAGYVTILDEEWALLKPSRGAWTVAPKLRPARRGLIGRRDWC